MAKDSKKGVVTRLFRTICESEVYLLECDIPTSEIIELQREIVTMKACVRNYCKVLGMQLPKFVYESDLLN